MKAALIFNFFVLMCLLALSQGSSLRVHHNAATVDTDVDTNENPAPPKWIPVIGNLWVIPPKQTVFHG